MILWYMPDSSKDKGMQIPIGKSKKIKEAVPFWKQNLFNVLIS